MKEIKKPTSFKEATGKIEFNLKYDIVFHYTMQKSLKALTGLVCSLNGLRPEDVKTITVENPIDLNTASKETVMDIKLTLNNNEIHNIELQTYNDKYWLKRSIQYLCRAYDSIKDGDDYSNLKKTTHFCITDQDLFEDYPEFYSSYYLTNSNKKYSNIYSTDFSIKVLNLNHTDIATNEDIDNNLLYWASLFKANTWEELKALIVTNPIVEEVGNLIFELNTDNQTKELLEGKRRYREMLASERAGGREEAAEEYLPIIKEKDELLAEKDKTIAEKDARIAELEALLKKNC